MTRVRGWCPSAHRPMMSGDGLLVRVRPRMARMASAQAIVLADLALRFGNGLIDLTTRGNLQIRGVSEDDHPALLAALVKAGLVYPDGALELPLTVTPYPGSDTLTARLVAGLEAVARDLPPLPGKIGIVVDTGDRRFLSDVSGDFRVERGPDGLILRADGATMGRSVTVETAPGALLELAEWFVATGGREAGRMARHLARVPLPPKWQAVAPGAAGAVPSPELGQGRVGLAFGQVTSDDFRKMIRISGASEVVFTPWRQLLLVRAPVSGTDISTSAADISGVVTDISVPQSDDAALPDHVVRALSALGSVISEASDPLHRVVACPGAPRCAQAQVETRALARRLAPALGGGLHVSGCAKGCAAQHALPYVLVGRDEAFDLVLNGTAGDEAARRGLSEAELIQLFRAGSVDKASTLAHEAAARKNATGR